MDSNSYLNNSRKNPPSDTSFMSIKQYATTLERNLFELLFLLYSRVPNITGVLNKSVGGFFFSKINIKGVPNKSVGGNFFLKNNETVFPNIIADFIQCKKIKCSSLNS